MSSFLSNHFQQNNIFSNFFFLLSRNKFILPTIFLSLASLDSTLSLTHAKRSLPTSFFLGRLLTRCRRIVRKKFNITSLVASFFSISYWCSATNWRKLMWIAQTIHRNMLPTSKLFKRRDKWIIRNFTKAPWLTNPFMYILRQTMKRTSPTFPNKPLTRVEKYMFMIKTDLMM